MAKKQNPLLAAFEAKLRQEFAQELLAFAAEQEKDFQARLSRNTEMNLIATLIAGSDLGFLGEKRAGDLLAETLDVKMRIAEDIAKDAETDPNLVYTIADLARRVQQILGRAGWLRCQQLFPLLSEYWEGDGSCGEV